MNKKFMLIGIILALSMIFANSALATVTITGVTPTNAIEDTLSTFKLVQDTSALNGTAVYSLTSGPAGMTINTATGDLTWTPTNTHALPTAINSFTVSVSDDDGPGTPFSGTIAVTNTNDAPVLASIGNRKVFDGFNLAFTVTASDVDAGDSLIYSMSEETKPSGANFDVNTGGFTWTPTEDQRGKYENIEFRVTDAAGLFDIEIIRITVEPAYCDTGDETKLEIGNIDFDNDKYAIGESVSVTIENVEAKGDDIENVEVEIVLYNVKNQKEVDSWNSDDTFDIDDGDNEDFDLDFDIPNNEDIGKDDEYVLIAVATGDDDNNDEQCVQESEEIRIERETHDVIVDKVRLIPSVARPGDTVQLIVDVENIGTKDEDDVYVELIDSALGINLQSNRFDLKDYKDSDKDNTYRFSVKIPTSATPGDYSLEPVVFFDDDSENNGGKFVTLTVRDDGAVGTGGTGSSGSGLKLNVATQTNQIDASKGKANLHLLFTNNEDVDFTATVDINTIGNWAEPAAAQAVSLHTGDNNLYFNLKLKDVDEGTHSASVVVRPTSGNGLESKTFTLNFDVSGKTGGFGWFGGNSDGSTGSSVFWIIGDVVLVVVALFFIKLIFFGRKN